ncbi:hypothetical protein GA0115255_108273, partial [Streptomyces sp. Ncost-T6T-2b]
MHTEQFCPLRKNIPPGGRDPGDNASMDSSSAGPGLRERKKEATRQAVHEAT